MSNKSKLFFDAFDAIDDEFLYEAKDPRITIAVRRKKIIITSVAACLAAVLITIPSVKIISDKNKNTLKNSEIVAADEHAPSNSSTQSSTQGSAPTQTDENIDSYGVTISVDDLYLTTVSTNGPTNAYEKIFVPDAKYLYVNPLPSDKKHVTIYEQYYQKELSQSETEALANKYLQKIAESSKIELPQYKVSSYDDEIKIHADEVGFSVIQFQNRNIITLNKNNAILNGQKITVNFTQSDEEIINSLSSIKQALFDFFNVSFENVRITRNYTAYSNSFSLSVYFYNDYDHAINSYAEIMPYSDCIALYFSSDAGDLKIFNASYWSYRTDNHSYLNQIALKELLPLEKAEEYLNKGYVLAIGGCTLCQAEQTPVEFNDYDYVSLEYVGGYEIGDLYVPHYVFYKNIGTAENGNIIFAKTSVPAVEVQGYEEYFQNKHNNHINNNYVYEESEELVENY